ncbi:MAG: class I SAM-dependent methyltransferase [Methanomicrobiales archaeon]|nr:class I SAM-dependent methyltransferase [Methanomicrobiales archaeon]
MNGHDSEAAQAAWERDFRIRGRKYGRAPRDLPLLSRGSRILEMGCGDGKTLAAMASRGWEVYALDFSRSSLELCRENPLAGDVAYVLADAAALPFRDQTFDAVFLIHVAGHAVEPARGTIAAESSRVLRSGGRLFFRGFSSADFRAGRGTVVGPSTRLRGDGIMTHYFTRDEVIRLFSPLIPISVSEERWSLKIRERRYQRAEIAGEFRRK